MSTGAKKRITVRELREHPERYPYITQAAESFKPLVARFLAAKKEAEQVPLAILAGARGQLARRRWSFRTALHTMPQPVG